MSAAAKEGGKKQAEPKCWACSGDLLSADAFRCPVCQAYQGWRRWTGSVSLPGLLAVSSAAVTILLGWLQIRDLTDDLVQANSGLSEAKNTLETKELELAQSEHQKNGLIVSTDKLRAAYNEAHKGEINQVQELNADEVNVANEWVVKIAVGSRDKMISFRDTMVNRMRRSRYRGATAGDWASPLIVRTPEDSAVWMVAVDPSSGRSSRERVEEHLGDLRDFAISNAPDVSELLQDATVIEYPARAALLNSWNSN